MSYLTDLSDTLVARLWPDGLSQSIYLCGGQVDINANHNLPSKLETLVDYVDLVDDPKITNRFRNKCLVYKPLLAPDINSLWSVATRIHGFLEHAQIEPFGNWNG